MKKGTILTIISTVLTIVGSIVGLPVDVTAGIGGAGALVGIRLSRKQPEAGAIAKYIDKKPWYKSRGIVSSLAAIVVIIAQHLGLGLPADVYRLLLTALLGVSAYGVADAKQRVR